MKHISRYDPSFDEEYKRRGDRDNILRNIDEFNRKREIESDLAKTYYSYVPNSDIDKLLSMSIPFDIDEVNRIDKMFRSKRREYKSKFVVKKLQSNKKWVDRITKNIPIYAINGDGNPISISIWKLTDFYFLFGTGSEYRWHADSIPYTFYKCDQLDAVKFLIDKTIFEEE